MAAFQIDVNEDAAAEIAALPAFIRKQVVEAIETQLLHQPNVQTRNRKLLRGLVPPWEHLDPTWEIRIGEHRVFYDVDEAAAMVHIRAVRRKPPHRTTGDIL
ncbi:MAG: type II toxin-antitoxin system RelE/ParE family toxin [Pedosphaera sp.]|nr:type II toxin-antitoxin system RelE/ParE family toxin [Pedosphaera sp.]